MRRLPRWSLLSLAAVGLLYAAYLVLANVALRSQILRRQTNRHPESLLLEYRAAWTIFPGLVHVRGLRLRAQSWYVEWTLGVDEGRGWVDPTALWNRTVSLSGLRGRGIVFRLRNKLGPDEATPERTASLPPISGFDDSPILAEGPPPPPEPDSEIWSVALADAEVGVREVWVDEYRYLGRAVLVGARSKDALIGLGGFVEVPPATMRVRSGRVRMGDRLVADRVRGRVLGQVHRFDTRTTTSVGALDFVSSEVSLDGDLEDLVFVSSYLRRLDPRPEVSGGTGRIRARMALVRGVFRAGSRLDATALDVRVRLAGYETSSDVVTEWRVSRANGALRGRFANELSRVRVRDRDGRPFARAKEVHLDLETAQVRLRKFFSELDVDVEIHGARIDDLRPLARVLPDGLELARGSADLDGHVRFAQNGSGRADVALAARGLVARALGSTWEGNADAHLHAKHVGIGFHGADLSRSSVELRDVGRSDEDARRFWMRVALESARISEGPPNVLQARLRITAGDAAPLAGLVSDAAGVPEWAFGVFDLRELSGQADVVIAPDRLRLSDARAEGGNFRANAEVRRAKRVTHAIFLVRTGSLALGVDVRGGHVDVALFGATDWYEDRRSRLDGGLPRARRGMDPGHPAPSGPGRVATTLRLPERHALCSVEDDSCVDTTR